MDAERFSEIKAYYDTRDRSTIKASGMLVRDTSFGIWGTTHLDDAFTFFTRIRLERFTRFVDLGCGDGRVVLVASLFTRAAGIEGDAELFCVASEAKAALGVDADIRQGDYLAEPLDAYDCIFMFADKRFEPELVAKLQREFSGYLFVYNKLFAPDGLAQGKTYWVGQIPIASYAINRAEENLELRDRSGTK